MEVDIWHRQYTENEMQMMAIPVIHQATGHRNQLGCDFFSPCKVLQKIRQDAQRGLMFQNTKGQPE